MNHNVYRAVITILLSGIGFLTLQQLNAHSHYGSEQPGGFKRIIRGKAVINHVFPTKSNYYSAGTANGKCYFYAANPRDIIVLDSNFDAGILELPKDSAIERFSYAYKARLYSEGMEFYAINKASIYCVDMNTLNISKINVPRNYSRIIRISPNSYIVKGFDSLYRSQQLYKLTVGQGYQRLSKAILPEAGDIGFATDGNLFYDSISHQVIYVFLNCNQVLHLDTSLNILYRKSTVDTVSNPKIIAKKLLNKDNKAFYSYTKPTEYVNYTCCLHRGILYVNSLLKADNENINDFRENSVIDVYAVKNGKYLSSFYLPKYMHEGVKSIEVLDDKILATYQNAIISFSLAKPNYP
ncbi:hypothetical protein D3C87_298780 [compost metagenome]